MVTPIDFVYNDDHPTGWQFERKVGESDNFLDDTKSCNTFAYTGGQQDSYTGTGVLVQSEGNKEAVNIQFHIHSKTKSVLTSRLKNLIQNDTKTRFFSIFCEIRGDLRCQKTNLILLNPLMPFYFVELESCTNVNSMHFPKQCTISEKIFSRATQIFSKIIFQRFFENFIHFFVNNSLLKVTTNELRSVMDSKKIKKINVFFVFLKDDFSTFQ